MYSSRICRYLAVGKTLWINHTLMNLARLSAGEISKADGLCRTSVYSQPLHQIFHGQTTSLLGNTSSTSSRPRTHWFQLPSLPISVLSLPSIYSLPSSWVARIKMAVTTLSYSLYAVLQHLPFFPASQRRMKLSCAPPLFSSPLSAMVLSIKTGSPSPLEPLIDTPEAVIRRAASADNWGKMDAHLSGSCLPRVK